MWTFGKPCVGTIPGSKCMPHCIQGVLWCRGQEAHQPRLKPLIQASPLPQPRTLTNVSGSIPSALRPVSLLSMLNVPLPGPGTHSACLNQYAVLCRQC